MNPVSQASWRKQTIDQSQAKVPARRILVTVGTDHHRFDRLVQWFDEWVDQQSVADHIDALVQRGTSAPGNVDSIEYMEFNQLKEAIIAAEIVVTHGGPGSIMECRRAGCMPIVCPRDPAKGEHIDNPSAAVQQTVGRPRSDPDCPHKTRAVRPP